MYRTTASTAIFFNVFFTQTAFYGLLYTVFTRARREANAIHSSLPAILCPLNCLCTLFLRVTLKKHTSSIRMLILLLTRVHLHSLILHPPLSPPLFTLSLPLYPPFTLQSQGSLFLSPTIASLRSLASHFTAVIFHCSSAHTLDTSLIALYSPILLSLSQQRT